MRILRRGKLNGNNRGFTLIELSMVVLLIGLAVGILTPNLMDLGETRIKSAMRSFQGTVRFLFNESVFRKRGFLLHIDLAKSEYWVVTPQVSGSTVENIAVASSFIQKRNFFPEGVKITSVQSPRLGRRSEGEVIIRFFPHGYVEPTTIHLEDGKKNKYTLFIQPITGKVKIMNGHIEITRQS
jgi:general secretion pathway protein H